MNPLYVEWDHVCTLDNVIYDVPSIWRHSSIYFDITKVEYGQILSLCLLYEKYDFFDTVMTEYTKTIEDENVFTNNSKFYDPYINLLRAYRYSLDTSNPNNIFEFNDLNIEILMSSLVNSSINYMDMYRPQINQIHLESHSKFNNPLKIKVEVSTFFELIAATSPAVVTKLVYFIYAYSLFLHTTRPGFEAKLHLFCSFMIQHIYSVNLKSNKLRYCINFV